MRFADLADRRVAVWGAGREGQAALAALRARLPALVPALLCSAGEAAALGNLTGCEIITATVTVELLRRFDVVIKSPGISPWQDPAHSAAAQGVRFVSGSALWFGEHASARVIAVTGTKGKSTTTALIAHLLRAAGKRVALFGNIGMPLLELLDPPQAPDWWVMELSSFQTRDLAALPEVAVFLNLYPEHLDWHRGFENYRADKLRLLGTPSHRPRQVVIGAAWRDVVADLPHDRVHGVDDPHGFHADARGVWNGDRLLVEADVLPLPGLHNASNLAAALAAVTAAGVDPALALRGLSTFQPLPHRLQTLGERDGVLYINDSIATTPHATLAALAFFSQRRTTVLVGGYDRGVSWDDFRDAMTRQPAAAVIAMGQNGARIAATLAAVPGLAVHHVQTLEQAMDAAATLTPRGGVVLLSPGAPSFGAFRDYVERGRRFAELAGFDPDRISSIQGLGIA